MKMYRQGDVLLVETKLASDAQLKELPRDGKDRIVLAYGETTGHAHAITNRVARFFEEAGTDRWLLVVPEETELVHEEHAPVKVEVGVYIVIHQHEYHPAEIRPVVD